jgi:hypothetical protein
VKKPSFHGSKCDPFELKKSFYGSQRFFREVLGSDAVAKSQGTATSKWAKSASRIDPLESVETKNGEFETKKGGLFSMKLL